MFQRSYTNFLVSYLLLYLEGIPSLDSLSTPGIRGSSVSYWECRSRTRRVLRKKDFTLYTFRLVYLLKSQLFILTWWNQSVSTSCRVVGVTINTTTIHENFNVLLLPWIGYTTPQGRVLSMRPVLSSSCNRVRLIPLKCFTDRLYKVLTVVVIFVLFRLFDKVVFPRLRLYCWFTLYHKIYPRTLYFTIIFTRILQWFYYLILVRP